MSNRRPKYVVTLLLLISAIFASISYLNGPQPVSAVIVVTLTPNQGQPGQTITFTSTGATGGPTTCSISGSVVGTNSCTIQGGQPAGSFVVKSVAPGPYTVTVSSSPGGSSGQATFQVVQPALNTPIPSSGPPGTSVTITNSSDFASSDTTCSVSGTPVSNGACAIDSFTMTVTATFVVKNVAPAAYVITVSGSPIGDSAQTLFTVTASANITLIPTAGPPSTRVNATGSISSSDTTCTISGTPVTLGSCFLVNNSGTGDFNATFVVGNVAVGPYTITVTGNTGDSVKATFTVLSPSITLSPGSGVIGVLVIVNGTGFPFTDNTCTISSPTSGSFTKNPACSIKTGTGVASGTFNVGNVAVGSYVVRLTGNTGDFASATFVLTSGPSVTLSPASGAVGIQVIVNGTGFLPTDTTCSISGTPVQNGACSIKSGSGAPSGTFTVKNVAPGTYTITVSGNGGDSAQKTFVVTIGPTLTLSPGSGGKGILVIVNGTGFLPNDNHCTISGTGSVVTNAACLLNLGSGTPSGTFIVGNVAPGSFVITLAATPGGDSAQAVFIVTTGPSITLTPSSGTPGASIGVTGSSFSTSDVSCTISGAGGVVLSQSCSITAGSKTPTGSFVVGFAVPGFYLVTVTGNTGDSASASFRVLNVTKTLTLFPAKAANGATVTFSATGFNSTDTACVVQTNNPAPFVSFNNLLITSPTCTMSSTVATGSFVVGPFATQDVTWNVTVKGTPQNDIPASASFNVTATIVITPTVGNIGTVFSFTGSGFHSDAVDCTTLSNFQPALSGGSSLASNSGGCGMNGSTGQLTGTFTPPPGTFAGVYVLVVTDNMGSTASASFTIGTPSAQLTVSPNIVSAPGLGPTVSVSVTGSGFNAGDTTCTLTSISSPPLFTVSSCAISGGFVSGSFAVSSGAVPGLYLITVTGFGAGDFASNFLEVATVTSVTSTSFTTTTSTTATSTTTLTTFTSISSSLTTTTITSTGPTTIVFQQGTQTTVSAVTTTTSTTTGFTAFPTTQTTTTLQTVTFGQVMQPSIGDELSLLGMLLLVVPVLARRLLK